LANRLKQLCTLRPEVVSSSLWNSGIGLETSLQFAAEGARVLLSDINETTVEKAAEIVRSQFPSAEVAVIKCDVSKESDVKAMVDLAVQKWGRLDVLVSRS
jgi:NAD(P)-dependent dehydrogenase (short-subunit alcohol dehydrogenase family)